MSTRSQIESFHQTMTELGPRQYEIMDALIQSEPVGMSCWQLEQKLNRYVHAIRPRVNELRHMGYVYQSGERWVDKTQRHEAVWRVVQPDRQMQLL